MRIRAAVLEEFANPLVVQEVELDGPGPGEVLVRLAACGVCHTDLYTASGADPSGYAPDSARARGRGRRRGGRRGRDQRRAGRSRRDALLTPVPRVHPLRLRQDEPLPRHPRAAEQGLPARRHHAPPPEQRRHSPLHGHEHLRRGHRDARDRARQGEPRGAARRGLHARLRRHHGHRRRALHRQGRAGLDLRGLRRRACRPRRRGRRAAGRRRADHRHRPLRGAARARAPAGRHRHARRRPRQRRPDPRDDRRLRRRLHLRGHRPRRR